MSCRKCGANLRVKNRSESEPHDICAPCNSKLTPDPGLIHFDCPICGRDDCDCLDDTTEDTRPVLESEAMHVAGAEFARGCRCENPIVQHDEDGARCLCGSWV